MFLAGESQKGVPQGPGFVERPEDDADKGITHAGVPFPRMRRNAPLNLSRSEGRKAKFHKQMAPTAATNVPSTRRARTLDCQSAVARCRPKSISAIRGEQ